MVIHPENMMLERMIGKDGRCQIYINETGNVRMKMIKCVEVFALENILLEADKVVSVKVGWDVNVGIESNKNNMFMVDGFDAKYRVKRVAHVFDGILDINNPVVCVQVRPDVKRGRIRGIHIGDVLGSMYSVLNVEDQNEEGAYVFAGDIQKNDWEYDELIEKAKLSAELGDMRKQKVCRMLWERRKALSQGDDDFGNSNLPEFNIVLTDDTPIYQRPRHFPPQ